jgi:hypothetical protein
MKYIFSLLIALCFLVSCTEQYEIEFDKKDPQLVVEGIITDQPGPYYVRLTLSKSTFESQDSNDTISETWLLDGFKPVVDALVIISDDKGGKDTLINPPDSIYGYLNGMDGSIDSFITINPKGHFFGYYQTRNLRGKPGNTYSLMIKWHGKEYSSSCFMPPVPKIDSVTYSFTKGETGKSDYYIPHIWFKDNPNTKDYYLFRGVKGIVNGITNGVTLSDEFINSQIEGLDIFKGIWSEYWLNSYPSPGMPYAIELNSITKEIYEYYNALIAQVRSDGGVYTPSPASPPSNIKGGLGYFRASAVQTVEDLVLIN